MSYNKSKIKAYLRLVKDDPAVVRALNKNFEQLELDLGEGVSSGDGDEECRE